MKKILFISFIIISTAVIYGESPLLQEYDRLLEDFEGIGIWGYKGSIIIPSKQNQKYYNIQGSIMATSNVIDLAILGNGFFKVLDQINNRIFYTRNGKFKLSEDSSVVTIDGYKLQPEIRVVSLGSKLMINTDGSARLFNHTDDPVSNYIISNYQLNLYKPSEKAVVTRMKQYFTFSEAEIISENKIYQGFLELSSVQPIPLTTRLLFVIKEIKKENLPFEEIDTKIFIVENLWKSVMEENSSDRQAYLDFHYKIESAAPFLSRNYH